MQTKGIGDAGLGAGASPLRVGGILAGVVLAAVVIFSLGVMVGKRVAESTAPAVRPFTLPTENLIPSSPRSQESARDSGEKLTFYDTLAGKDVGGSPPLPQAAAPPAAGGAGITRAEAVGKIKALQGEGAYQVQVSSSIRKSWADDLVSRLGRDGLKATSKLVTVRGREYYRIRVGSFPDRDVARRAANLFKKGMKLDAMVVRGE